MNDRHFFFIASGNVSIVYLHAKVKKESEKHTCVYIFGLASLSIFKGKILIDETMIMDKKQVKNYKHHCTLSVDRFFPT